MMTDVDNAARRKKNLRTVAVLALIAVGFYVGFIVVTAMNT